MQLFLRLIASIVVVSHGYPTYFLMSLNEGLEPRLEFSRMRAARTIETAIDLTMANICH